MKFSPLEKHPFNRLFTVVRCLKTLFLLVMITSCRTQPPSIFLHGSLDPKSWITEPIYKVSRDRSDSAAKVSIVEVIDSPDPPNLNKLIVEKTVYTETTTQDEFGKNVTVMHEDKPATDTSSANATLTGNDTIYRRKLNLGDVIYFLQGEHHKMAQSRFIPLEGEYRIPLRHINKKYSELKDYEKLFLNFIIGTHLVFDNDSNDFTGAKPLFLDIVDYYENHKVELWNALVNNIYYQYSQQSGNTIVVNFNKMQTDLPSIPSNFFKAHETHLYPEVISRPNILPSEVISWLSQTNIVIPIDFKNVLYYIRSSSGAPFIFNLGAVELNGVRIDGSQIENTSWNIFDWKHCDVRYIVKNTLEADISMKILKLKRGMITSNYGNRHYKLNIDYDNHEEIGIKISTTSEGVSRIIRTLENVEGRTIQVRMQEVKFIKPDMIRKINLKKHFKLK